MKVVFIAGPFRAPTPWGVEQNIRAAEEAALQVWSLGAAALCPHTNTRFFDRALPDEIFLAGTRLLLSRCDAMLVVGNWKDSEGTREEINWASNRNIPKFFHIEDLSRWLAENL